jgi:Flp pilus assembly protein TadG
MKRYRAQNNEVNAMNGFSERWLAGWRQARVQVQEVYRRWNADLRGASLVQFVVVLPVFVVIVVGLYAVFTVMSARDTLCEATYEASRYLQVEGPHFSTDNPDFDEYPADWIRVATDIINQELASRTHTELYPVLSSDVSIDPPNLRNSPKDTIEVRDNPIGVVENAWFTVKVTKAITNPMGAMLGTDPGLATIKLSCKATGFFEGPPIGPTKPGSGGGGPNRCEQPVNQCRRCPGCTPTTVGAGTPTECPTCRP